MEYLDILFDYTDKYYDAATGIFLKLRKIQTKSERM